jgi:nucleoside-diphosphate-sugar epimerase
MSAAKPERVVNLSYFIGSEHAPHVAMKLNILGMDNCFEAARLLGVKHTMYASSLAVNGKQANYGRPPGHGRRPGERRIPIRQAQDHE